MRFTLDPDRELLLLLHTEWWKLQINNTVDKSEVYFISVFEVAALTIISHKLITFRASM